ncbi:hypothetical protein AgCh_028826 [Apium graveolens]
MALLSQFEEKVGPLVTFGDNNKCFTMEYRKLISGNVVIEDVELVASLEVNLLNQKTSEVALKGERKGNLFVANLDSTNEDEICCFYTKASVEQSKLWHKKPSHLNFKTINNLVKKELVRDMPNLKFSQDEDIVQEFLASRTPQQNGVVERKNRTLVEAARTMLQDAKLPTSVWEEVVNTACLQESWQDNSKYVGKFDSKVFEAIFLGYSLERTAYKVYVIDQKKIMESADVTFDDDKCPDLECLSENEAETLQFENLKIDSNSEDEAEVNTNQKIYEEGEKGENSKSHANDEEEAENTSQQTHTRKWDRSHNADTIIGYPNDGVRTRSATASECLHANFLSQVEPKKTEEALLDSDWISATQEELNQFERNKVWKLVPAPKNRSIIGTKWVFRNKMDENGIVTRNYCARHACTITRLSKIDNHNIKPKNCIWKKIKKIMPQKNYEEAWS